MFYTLLYQPLVNGLIFFYKIFDNFGVAIIVLTILIRLLTIPLTLPSLKVASKMKELAPQLEKLKKKYGKDRQKFAQAQLEIYKKHKVNPAAGCLPQIIQLIILIALYQAFIKVLQPDGNVIEKLNEVLYPVLQLPAETVINSRFFYLDLAKPDVFHLPGVAFPLPGFFLLLAALVQFLSSKMMQPAVAVSRQQAKETPAAQDDVAAAMQTQMLYLFPLMTILIGYSFPSGLVLYWLVFSVFTAVQQYFVSGLGGLEPWRNKLKVKS
ncbi:MAG: YidC/Oxa1 family membrane protein insertase [Microgenomates group bacterium]